MRIDGRQSCCPYYFPKNNECEECPPGYFNPNNDDNCKVFCRHPSYGALCGDFCNCSKEDCHHVYGCHVTSIKGTTQKTPEIHYSSSAFYTELMEDHIAVHIFFSRTMNVKNVLQDTFTKPTMSTAVSRVVIHHTELCERVAVTVLRRTVTTSMDVL
nr:uncharacterized protein LOC117692473 [Crassostrea gigas]